MLTAFGLIGAAGGIAPGSFDLISTTVLSSTTSSVTFDVSALASTYKHLQIRHVVRGDSDSQTTFARFNSDANNNYSSHRLFAYNGSIISDSFTARSNLFIGSNGSSDLSSTIYSASVVDIFNPFDTLKNTTTRTLCGFHGVAPGGDISVVHTHSGAYYSTNTITSINIIPNVGNFISGSRFSLYGIKG